MLIWFALVWLWIEVELACWVITVSVLGLSLLGL